MISILIAAAVAAAPSPPAGDTDKPKAEEYTPLGSLISRPVPGLPEDTLEFKRAAVVLQKFSRCVVKYAPKGAAAIVERDLTRLAGLLHARRHHARSQPQTQLFQFVFQCTVIPKSGQQIVSRTPVIEVRCGSRNKA